MSRSIETNAPIAASAERVWAILVDFARYPEWNPWLTSVRGSPEPKHRLKVVMVPADGRTVTFHPRVARVEPGRELSWRSRAGVPGLYDGHRVFRITPIDTGHCRFEQNERFTGLLVALAWQFTSAETRDGFTAMNEALRIRAESGS
jgi:hypothetical protein